MDAATARKIITQYLKDKFGHNVAVRVEERTLRETEKGVWNIGTIQPAGYQFRITHSPRGTPVNNIVEKRN